MREWRERNSAGEQLAVYAQYMKKDTLARNKNSMWRSWQHQVFGKDWFYWFFLAFGTIDNDMLEVTQAVCDERALYAGEAKAAGRQGDSSDDDELDLTERIPWDKRSQAFILRENARKEEKKFKAQQS